tara:strand:+ start:21898 stop:22296 length:399 start_codon:yes stop_codon:yes gene_type:complete
MTDKPEVLPVYRAAHELQGDAMVVRLSDYDALAAQSAADKARIAELTEQRDSFQRVGIQSMAERDELLGLSREVTSVAITMLYDSHKDDVIKEFSLKELEQVVGFTDHLESEAVESIYRKAWDTLAKLGGGE